MGTLELQPGQFLNPSNIVISSEAFWNIGKHCRIEVRCVALQPEDAGAETADWVPKGVGIGPQWNADKLKPTNRLQPHLRVFLARRTRVARILISTPRMV